MHSVLLNNNNNSKCFIHKKYIGLTINKKLTLSVVRIHNAINSWCIHVKRFDM